MNTEIEVRILNIDKEDLISKLEQNNAEFIGDWLQIRYVYDFNPVDPHRWIRLRTNGITNTLTIKEVHDKTELGTKELEIEINLTDEEIELIKLGHVPFEMEDHWFMYFDEDDNTINYYHSWTGMPVFKGYLDPDNNKVYKLIVSLEKEVYTKRNTNEQIINQFKRLIENEILCHK